MREILLPLGVRVCSLPWIPCLCIKKKDLRQFCVSRSAIPDLESLVCELQVRNDQLLCVRGTGVGNSSKTPPRLLKISFIFYLFGFSTKKAHESGKRAVTWCHLSFNVQVTQRSISSVYIN